MAQGRKEKSSAAAMKFLKKIKKRKKDFSNSSIIESSEQSTEACHLYKKYWILQMQSFFRLLPGSMWYGQQAQAEKEKQFQDLRKVQQGVKCSN